MTTKYTVEEVAKHNTEKDAWIIVDKKVFNVTNFLSQHPGGKKILLKSAGQDATKQFNMFHSASVLQKYSPTLLIGVIDVQSTNDNKSSNNGSKVVAVTTSNNASKKVAAVSTEQEAINELYEKIPFADPYWYHDFSSPYYTDGHRAFRDKIRVFVEKHIRPYGAEWDESGDYPSDLQTKAYAAGVLSPMWPTQYGGTPPPEGYDAFHDLIWNDELARAGFGGVLAAAFFIQTFALPPVIIHGSDYVKDLCARDVVTGKKIIALAVSEPTAGSDVASISTTARREGDYYIVNGSKKFITAGNKASFFTTAVRTGGEGMGGISLLLIERNTPGISIHRLKTQGWWSSGTTLVNFDDVKVPVKNIIGKENNGFKYIMYNFNHERFVGASGANRGARACIEEAIKYARQRTTFGKRLIDHQVIRHKIAEMARRVESTHALLEQIAYQMNNAGNANLLGGTLALAKVQATRNMEYCAREASQILGGASYIRGGLGERVERIYREVRVNAIGGGSEEVMLDLAMRQARL